jgi:hypothetical protein
MLPAIRDRAELRTHLRFTRHVHRHALPPQPRQRHWCGRLANGVLAIRGEKRTEVESKDRLFSERSYGRFERRIEVDDVEEDKVAASFKNGVLTVTLPKSPAARQKVKRIAVNGN